MDRAEKQGLDGEIARVSVVEFLFFFDFASPICYTFQDLRSF